MKKMLLSICLLLPALLSGQVESIVIQWDKDHGIPSFPHALYEDGENTLPYYTRIIPWGAAGMLPSVRLEVRKTSQLETGPGVLIPDGHVLDEPLLEYSLVRASKTPYLSLKVLPFLRDEAGRLLRVESFDLHIEKEVPLASLKSAISGNWSDRSVLATGNWFMVSIRRSGIHKLTYEQLKEIGLDNPASARVYGSGASLLPENFSEGYTDDLKPVPVHMVKGSDGLFGPGDFILFYAHGNVAWGYNQEEGMFLHRLHPYSWTGYYFLTDDLGTAVFPGDLVLSSAAPTHTVTGYDYRSFVEPETYNLINSGREWYGDNFNVDLEKSYSFPIAGKQAGEAVRVRVVPAARSNESSSFHVRVNGQVAGSITLNGTDLSTYTATYAFEMAKVFTAQTEGEAVTVDLEYGRPDSNSDGWLNSITINGRSALRMGLDIRTGSDELDFRDMRSVGPGNVGEFRVENAGGSAVIWEITDPGIPLNIPYTLAGNTAVFRTETDELREFIAFDTKDDFPSPEYKGEGLGAIGNQDLHGLQHPEMIIITPEIFLEEAERLAEHRRTNDGLDVEVVLQQQVFNEFSSGTPDVTAIRNFMKMFYDRSGGSPGYCRYLLLFGDGSYDNRGVSENNPNLILTYQSDNSLSPTRSYVSDDYFGLLDTDESMYNGLLDIGIGRLPISDSDEAFEVVNKIISYSEPSSQGDWRNLICFIGDDEDGNIHMRQADELATIVRNRYPWYNINKIYLDAYPQERLATGFRYPAVNRAINEQMNRGALILNYTGHGGPQGLAHEQILTMNEINSWSNRNALPLFMTATCEFSRYDEYDQQNDQEITSAGEEVLLNNNGGGIGLFSTTRLVYSGPNHVLNVKFYDVVFEKDEDGEYLRLGDIIAYSKNNTGAGINKRNFTLLGDPAMRLAYPKHRVITDSINGFDVALSPDTISAFDWVTVSGHMETQGGAFLDGFNGHVYPLVYDKEINLETLSNDNDPVWGFKSRSNILYSGKATVTGGRFSFSFFVPKDINYAVGTGKISYYSNNGIEDGSGSSENFYVGGIGSENETDNQPPEIRLFLNDTFFLPGGTTDPDPVLLAFVSDNFGINTTGNGIGHDLIATLNEDRINAILLNNYYQANTNSFNSGVIRYPYRNLETGRHEIRVKIWDIHNNSAESTLEFVVMDSEEMLLEQLRNYPNPFVDETYFNIEHNRPDRNISLVLTIYNLSGEMVRIIEQEFHSPGYRLEPLRWDGTSSGGKRLGGGVYLYRAIITTDEGETATESGKLVITR